MKKPNMTNPNHLRLFEEFCRYEQLCGGPDPHLRAVIEMCGPLPREQQIWRIALYVGFYNVPTAEATWCRFPESPGPDKLLLFLQKHWDGLRFRRERKSVALDSTRGERMVDYCDGVATTIEALDWLEDEDDFEQVWRFAMRLPHVGRYAATKLCECWYRIGLIRAECRDIRAKNGWSPRTCLNMVLERTDNPRDDSYRAVIEAEERALYLKNSRPELMRLSWFQYEVMLCEYKASFLTKRQYPGRSLDSELSYERSIEPYWGSLPYPGHEPETEHMKTRRRLHPEWSLGEVQDWDPGERLGYLGRVVSEYGYTWTDSLYDYHATRETGDFSHPIRRNG